MQLWEELLYDIPKEERPSTEKILESRAYLALKEIQKILDDQTLDDATCFWKIEKIVQIFEEIGSNGRSRHDF